jgi:hypothetical protein
MKDIVTWSKMQKFLKTYMSYEEIASWKYVNGSQHLSDNGHAYAKFLDNDGFEHTLCISDYVGGVKNE